MQLRTRRVKYRFGTDWRDQDRSGTTQWFLLIFQFLRYVVQLLALLRECDIGLDLRDAVLVECIKDLAN